MRRAVSAICPHDSHRPSYSIAGASGLQVQDVGDAPAEWMVGHHRILGVAASPSERAASSACPSGFPSRV